MKKKMMLIVPMLHQGGFERVCVTTARLMVPYFDVTIVVFNSANIAYDVTGLNIIDIQAGVQKGKLRKLLNIFKRAGRVRALKKSMHPDIAYSFGPTANLVNAFSKTKETKVWLGLRNYTDIEERFKIRLFVKKADLIICCSKEIEQELRSTFHFKPATTLYNLYDVEAIKREAAAGEPKLPWPEDQEEYHYLLSMGRDADQKGFWHMIKAFVQVHRMMPNTRLIILGAGSFQEYRKLVADYHLQDAVFFAGMQKQPYPYLKKGAIYLMTSLNEGFPNALVEGMALGLAAISTDCKTGPAEILLAEGSAKDYQQIFREKLEKKEAPVIYGDYGILVPCMSSEKNLDASDIAADEECLAGVIVKVLKDPELLARYQKLAAERAKIFTYQNYVEKMLLLAEKF